MLDLMRDVLLVPISGNVMMFIFLSTVRSVDIVDILFLVMEVIIFLAVFDKFVLSIRFSMFRVQRLNTRQLSPNSKWMQFSEKDLKKKFLNW